MAIYFIRHGESIANVENKQISKNSPLTEKGIRQVIEKRNKFKDIHFDAVYSSDYKRTEQTALILAGIKEVYFASALREQYKETDEQVLNRVKHFIQMLQKNHFNQTILCVTHAIVIKVLTNYKVIPNNTEYIIL